MYASYFSVQLRELKQEYREHIYNSDFYRYYRSGRTDRDETYFRLGNINFLDGLNSFVFEIDPLFSTYNDNKVARIIANELLYTYILQKINDDEIADSLSARDISSDGILWTDTKNALIELIYALHYHGVFDNGSNDIREVAQYFQSTFGIDLGNFYQTYLKLRNRKMNRTKFLDALREELIRRMDE